MFMLQDIYTLYPFASRRGVARVLSTFLCAVAVAIRPLARLGGSQAFLALTLKELVFSCQGTLAQQIELTSLNILGAMLAIGVSTFTRFLAVSIFTEQSPAVRVIPAFALVGISFYGAYMPSTYVNIFSDNEQLVGLKAACQDCKCRCESLALCPSGCSPLTEV